MSIGRYAVGEAAVGQSDAQTIRSKTAFRRTYTALADAKVIPEQR